MTMSQTIMIGTDGSQATVECDTGLKLNLGAEWTCNAESSWVDASNELLTEDLVCADLCTASAFDV